MCLRSRAHSTNTNTHTQTQAVKENNNCSWAVLRNNMTIDNEILLVAGKIHRNLLANVSAFARNSKCVVISTASKCDTAKIVTKYCIMQKYFSAVISRVGSSVSCMCCHIGNKLYYCHVFNGKVIIHCDMIEIKPKLEWYGHKMAHVEVS